MTGWYWRSYRSILWVLLMAPLSFLVLWAFSKNWPWPLLWPEAIGFRGLEHLMRPESEIRALLGNSVTLSLTATVMTLVLSIPAAKALGCYDFPGKKMIYLFLLMPILVPPITVAMGIHISFIRWGLANSFWGVVIVHIVAGMPYAVRILTHAFELMGDKMEMQAKMLGATRWQSFTHVTLPLIAPGLMSAGSLVFIVSFSQYFITFFIGGGRVVTLPMAMFPYIQSGDRGMASVYSLCFIAVAMGVLFGVETLLRRFYQLNAGFYLSEHL